MLGSCMYSFLPAKKSVSSELLQNLNVVHVKRTQLKKCAVPLAFKMKLGSASVRRSVLGEILLYVTAVDYSSYSSYSSGLQQWIIVTAVTLCHHLQSSNKAAYFGRLRIFLLICLTA